MFVLLSKEFTPKKGWGNNKNNTESNTVFNNISVQRFLVAKFARVGSTQLLSVERRAGKERGSGRPVVCSIFVRPPGAPLATFRHGWRQGHSTIPQLEEISSRNTPRDVDYRPGVSDGSHLNLDPGTELIEDGLST